MYSTNFNNSYSPKKRLGYGNRLNGDEEQTGFQKAETVVGVIVSIVNKIGGVIQNIFGGAYSDRPLIRTRDEIHALFLKNGYSTVDVFGKSIMEKYGLRQAQIDDRSKSVDYYTKKFAKLYEYVIAVLSDNGRADLVPQFIANTPLYVPGGTKSIPYLSQLLAANRPGKLVNPPGSQIPLIPPGSIKPPSTVANESGQNFSLPNFDQATNAYQVIKDAQGKIIQVRDAYGQIVNPGTTAYNQAVQNDQGALNQQQAGIGTVGKIVIGAIGLSALVYIGSQMGNASASPKKKLNGPQKPKRKSGRKKKHAA